MMKTKYEAPQAQYQLFVAIEALAEIGMTDLLQGSNGPGSAVMPSQSDIKIKL